MFMLIGKMELQPGDIMEKLELRKTSKENESLNKHDNNGGNNCIDNVLINIISGSSTRHIFVRWTQPFCHFTFFHYIGAWTLNSFADQSFCHLSHRFCKNVIRLTIVIIFTMSEFNCLFCENYIDHDIRDNSYVLVYFYVCVLLSMLFYIGQHLGSRLVWNKNNYSEWNTVLQQPNPNGTNRNIFRNGTNIVLARDVGKYNFE